MLIQLDWKPLSLSELESCRVLAFLILFHEAIYGKKTCVPWYLCATVVVKEFKSGIATIRPIIVFIVIGIYCGFSVVLKFCITPVNTRYFFFEHYN